MQLRTPVASSQQLRLMNASGQHPALLVRVSVVLEAEVQAWAEALVVYVFVPVIQKMGGACGKDHSSQTCSTPMRPAAIT